MLAVIAFVITRPDQSEPVTPTPQSLYVSLGDSVAAGVGLEGDSDSSACNRTNQSYPNVIAQARYKLVNLACSGATISAGIVGGQEVNKLVIEPQIDTLFKQPKPNLITITVGANDAHWTDVIAACYTRECGSADDERAVTASLALVSSGLETMLSSIQDHYRSDMPTVVITGYHQVFPDDNTATCADLSGIDASERAWGRQLQTHINNVVAASAQESGFARFAAIDFVGHELCTNDPWVQGLTAKQPYHPTASGQTAIANQVLMAIGSSK